MTLHADAVRVLTEWTPPDAEQAELRQRFLDLLHTEPGAVRADHPGAHITASVLVVDAEADRVLLCLHGRIHRWVQLGGHLEPHDLTVVGAGLLMHPAPIHLDVHRVNCRYGPADHYDVRFAAIAPAGAIEQVSDESAALGWFAPLALPHPLASATEPLVGPALAIARQLRTGAELRSGAGHLGA